MKGRAFSLLCLGPVRLWSIMFLLGFTLAVLPALAQDVGSDVHIVPRVSADAPKPTAPTAPDPSLGIRTKPYKSEVELVLVPVTVTDEADRLVTGLEKENFQIFQDKQPQVIQHLSSEDSPISMGIILDLSGSMSDKIEHSRQAVVEFMKTANPQDEFFVIGFSDKPELLSEFTRSIEDIEAKMVMTQPKGMTALLDAIYLGLHEMKKAQHPRRALLIISDGGDNHSRYSEREVKSLVKEADVQIYAVGIFEPLPPTVEEQQGPELLREVTEATGGRTFAISNAADLADAATKIGIQLRQEYVLGYRPSAQTKDGKWHKIKVKLIPPKGLPPLRVTAKQGFYASPQ